MPFRVTLPLVVVAAFVAVGLLAGNSRYDGDPDTITIVSSLPRSGSARGQTDTIVKGIRLAIDELNTDGTYPKLTLTDPDTKRAKTYRVNYLDLDDATAAAGAWTIEQEIANANQAKSDPDVMAYIGTYNSGAAKVSMPILNRAGLFMVSPANTAPALTQPGTGDRHEPMCYRPTGQVNYTRVVPTDDLQGELSARWMKDLGAKKVYILDDNELYGKGVADLVDRTLRGIGVEVLGHQSIDTKSQEFTALMTNVKKLGPDMIYFGGTTQSKAGQLFKDMIKVGLTCPMMGPDGCFEQAMIESAGRDAFEKVPFYATFGGLPLDALTEGRGAEFLKKYTEKYGGPPSDAYAAYGYECGLVALEALKRAGKKDREAVRRAGIAIKDFDGTTGLWSFDANGDTTNPTMIGNTVKDGKFKVVKRLSLPKK